MFEDSSNKKVITIFNIKGGVGSTSLIHLLASHLGSTVYEESPDYFSYLKTGSIIDPDNIKPGIYDINEKKNGLLIKKVLRATDILVVPTHFDFKDIYKAVITLSLAIDANEEKSKSTEYFILFNGLSSSSKDRESKYRKQAQRDIHEGLQALYPDLQLPTINYLYFRTSFAVFRDSRSGNSLLSHYMKQTKSLSKVDRFYQDSNFKSVLQEDFEDTFFTNNEHLELLYQYIYFEPMLKEVIGERMTPEQHYHTLYTYLYPKGSRNEFKRHLENKYTQSYAKQEEKFIEDFHRFIKVPAFMEQFEHTKKTLINNRKKKNQEAEPQNIDAQIAHNINKIGEALDIKDSEKKNSAGKKETIKGKLSLAKEQHKELLSPFYNLTFLKNHRKTVRDFRNLLIALGVYLNG